MKYICFVEPANKRADPQYVIMSAKTAIQCQQEAAQASGHKYLDDEQALMDFIVINWAFELTNTACITKELFIDEEK